MIRNDGFSLVECLTAVAIVGIMAAMAVPSFTEYTRNAELGSVTNSLVSALSSTKSESMNAGHTTAMAPTDGLSWNKGWTIFVDANQNGVFDAAEKKISSAGAVPNNITIEDAVGSKSFVLFDSVGFVRDEHGGFTNRTLQVKRLDAIADPAKQRRVKVASSGRIRSCKPLFDTDPDCKATGL